MKSIVVTYPDFQSLPKGVKRMLVESESHFFDESKPAAPPRMELRVPAFPTFYPVPTAPLQPVPFVAAFSE